MSIEIEHIGPHTLYRADCRDVLPMLDKVDAVVTDPPYSERTHRAYDESANGRKGGDASNVNRKVLAYGHLHACDVWVYAKALHQICKGWIVWMTDHTLIPSLQGSLEKLGRYVFAPLPFYEPGSRVRLSGDGPSSWTTWIVVARTKAQARWGTLPGGYLSKGWNDKQMIGGKPTKLMEHLVSDYSRQGDVVLDPFMGAGTTGVACSNLGRRFIGVEIDREHFDLACKRIEHAHAQLRLFA